MKVLIACEESQIVCKALRDEGHEAYSCDLQSCSGGHPEWHIQGNVRNHLYPYVREIWDLVIAHPPCTRLCNSGVRWLHERNLWDELDKACEFFNLFVNHHKETGTPVCIENPIPHKYAVRKIGRYDQIIQPWQFGHGETKATCLWLYGLPELKPTNIVEGRKQNVWKMAPSEDRSKLRSKTFPGIAQAMAQQWTSVSKQTVLF